MSAFYEIAGAVLPPLLCGALAVGCVGIVLTVLVAFVKAFQEAPLIREARCVVAEMRMRSFELYHGTCKPTAGRFTLAVELWEFADRVDHALGARRLPQPPWTPQGRAVAGCGPCHGGRVAGSTTPPREDER